MISKTLTRGLHSALIAAAAVMFILGQAPLAQAEDKASDIVRDLLSELLKGSRDDDAAMQENQAAGEHNRSGTNRRLPFSRRQMQLSFAPLVESTAPAVVNVYAARQVETRSPFGGDPFFEQFFGRRPMPPRIQSSLGSGVIVDPSGVVVTNYHVIGGADEVKVALSDGREYESRVLLKEESLDLAILKIDDRKPFPSLSFGDSESLLVGDLVLAIGNPFGVGQTTTSGIVSALARTHVGVSDFGFFIQTDAAINPGNSGGALIDMNGNLIGINTAIFTRSGGSNGIGFAIPSNLVRAVVSAAQSGEDEFVRPWLGAEFQPITAAVADSLGMRRPVGALVGNVTGDSPADRAGLRPGDVVLAVNNFAVEHPDALGYRLATLQIGSTAVLQVLRRGNRVAVNVVLEREPSGSSAIRLTIEGNSPFAGAIVTNLDRRLARKLRIKPGTQGVVIENIENGAPAARFGLQPGDIVREVNGVEIDTPVQLDKVASTRSRWWKFSIERNGRILRQVLRF